MLILQIFILITDGNKEIVRVLYIYYLIRIYKDEIWILFDSKNKVNPINLDYV